MFKFFNPYLLRGVFSAVMITFGGVLYIHGYSGGSFLWRCVFLMIVFFIFVWLIFLIFFKNTYRFFGALAAIVSSLKAFFFKTDCLGSKAFSGVPGYNAGFPVPSREMVNRFEFIIPRDTLDPTTITVSNPTGLSLYQIGVFKETVVLDAQAVVVFQIPEPLVLTVPEPVVFYVPRPTIVRDVDILNKVFGKKNEASFKGINLVQQPATDCEAPNITSWVDSLNNFYAHNSEILKSFLDVGNLIDDSVTTGVFYGLKVLKLVKDSAHWILCSRWMVIIIHVSAWSAVSHFITINPSFFPLYEQNSKPDNLQTPVEPYKCPFILETTRRPLVPAHPGDFMDFIPISTLNWYDFYSYVPSKGEAYSSALLDYDLRYHVYGTQVDLYNRRVKPITKLIRAPKQWGSWDGFST